MRLPVIGLDATVFRDDCEQIVLSSDGSPERVLIHEGQDRWRLATDGEHTRDDQGVRQMIGEHLVARGDAIVCTLPNERVEFRVERKGIQIRRSPRVSLEELAEELGPMNERLVTAFGGVGTNRKEKLRQAAHFGKVVLMALARDQGRDLRILDAACGRSYLGLMLTLVLRSKGWRVKLQGIDYNKELVDKASKIADSLDIRDAKFEVADVGTFPAREMEIDMVISLHGCDTLSDDAMRLAIESKARYAFIAPCCHHEMRHGFKIHPLDWISRYGLLEQRLADVLTDGLRALVFEAFGYKVNVIRFADLELTPKNLLIQAVRTPMQKGRNAERAKEARALAETFGVRTAALRLLQHRLPEQ